MPPFNVDRFGGLVLSADPEEVGPNAAIDLLDVDFDLNGRVRSRDGYTQFSASALDGTTVGLNLVPYDSTKLLALSNLSGTTVYLNSYTSGGVRTSVGNWTGSGQTKSIAQIGTPTSTLVFIADTNVATTLRKYDGTTVGTSTGKPRFLAVSPIDNRLIQASYFAAGDTPSGANGSMSTLFWSDPGAPETFTATSYDHLRPGDGEGIVGLVTWRDLTFAFKSTAAWIFYGTGTTGAGLPEFLKRPIGLPSPLINPNHVVAGHKGVYYTTRDGMWRTDGGQPQLISGPVNELFNPAGTTALELATEPIDRQLSAANGRIFYSFTGPSSVARLLVYDEWLDVWTCWTDIQGTGVGTGVGGYVSWTGRLEPRSTVYFTGASSQIYKLSTASTTDNGAAIASSYQSGWFPAGKIRSDGKARVRGVALRGTGSPTLSVFTDGGLSDPLAAAVTLGTAPTVARGLHPKSYLGRIFSYKLSASSVWQVNSLTVDEYP